MVKKFTKFGLFLLGLGVLAACGQHASAEPPALVASVTAEMDSAFVTRGEISNLYVFPGLVRAETEAARVLQGAGRIEAIYAWPGDAVYEGQVLARLNAAEIEARLEVMEQNLRDSQTLFSLNQQIRAIEIEIFERDNPENLEEIEWLRLELSHLQRRHDVAVADAREAIDQTRGQLGERNIVAPISGEVVFALDLDTWVNVGDVVMYISNPDAVFVEYVGMRWDIFRVRHAVKFNGYIGDRVYNFERIYITIEEQMYHRRRNLPYHVRFEIVDTHGYGLPRMGEPVMMYFYTIWNEDALRAPANAVTILFFGNQGFVYRIEDGQRQRVYVTIGSVTDAYIEILEGLYEGDKVFIRP